MSDIADSVAGKLVVLREIAEFITYAGLEHG